MVCAIPSRLNRSSADQSPGSRVGPRLLIKDTSGVFDEMIFPAASTAWDALGRHSFRRLVESCYPSTLKISLRLCEPRPVSRAGEFLRQNGRGRRLSEELGIHNCLRLQAGERHVIAYLEGLSQKSSQK